MRWVLVAVTALLSLNNVALAEEAKFEPLSALVPAPWTAEMDREIGSINRRYSGKLAAYVSDPYRGYRYGYNAGKPFYLASGVKIAFMIEVFRQREAGTLTFEETVVYDETCIRDGAPRVNKQKLGAKISIATLLDWMMRSSDNAATDMLARRVGVHNTNAGLRAEGIDGFTPLTHLVDVRRGIYRNVDIQADSLSPLDVRTIRWTRIWNPQVAKLNSMLGRPRGTYSKADLLKAYDRYYETGVNSAPMASVGLIFEKMVRGQLVSEKASREMLDLMSAARTSTHRILGRLPRGTRVAHKTGSQFMRLCDLGVVFLPDDKPIIVTVCTAGGTVPSSESAVARIARKAYDLTLADHGKK